MLVALLFYDFQELAQAALVVVALSHPDHQNHFPVNAKVVSHGARCGCCAGRVVRAVKNDQRFSPGHFQAGRQSGVAEGVRHDFFRKRAVKECLGHQQSQSRVFALVLAVERQEHIAVASLRRGDVQQPSAYGKLVGFHLGVLAQHPNGLGVFGFKNFSQSQIARALSQH